MLHSFSYVTDHLGFCGTIKNSPSDFVVTEIEVPEHTLRDGRAESLPKIREAPLEQSSLSVQQPKKLRADPAALCASRDCRGAVPSPPETPPGQAGVGCFTSRNKNHCENEPELKCSPEEANILDSLLGKPVSELLNKFAYELKAAWSSGNDSNASTCEFSLGPVLDKQNRAGLHSVIRQEFPFLVTVTKDSEMIVKGNADYRELCQLVTEKEANDFFKFLDAKLENSTFSFEPDGNKEHRKAVHHFISRKFGKLLETKSFTVANVNDQPNMSIMVRFREKSWSRKRPTGGPRENQDLYTAFTLQKENLETLEAIGFLASELGILASDFSYTGIKDKKAITYQPMVVKKVTPERLKEIGSRMEKKGMRIHNIHSACQHLRLGQLKGNHFDIVVRDLKHHSHDSSADLKERICEAIEKVETKGFVNYYGPQRFGQGQNVQTDQIGLALLNEKMVEAVKLFFMPEDTDDTVNRAKRYFLQTEDAKGTLTMLPEFKVREKMMLRALNRYGVNHEGCTKGWLNIPHSMRIFYVHAYCSKIWNEAASYRLKTYGSKVVEGDLVLSEENDENFSVDDKVHIVTASEESANKYSIHQVVLPVVGHSIKYPSNKVGQWYHERLSKDELQMCKFRVSPLQLNIPGCYRPILKNVQNLSYFLEGSEKALRIEDNHLNESKISLYISFDLDPSCYATVCLREIMKCDF
ncbi:pseudouridylate synthase PUS7L [Dromaius novaehollandiae]|uniref:Pseudouridylate synthase PUS7L n=1 Tax=Dromaius novaehollandiae TaxID=8790 RepID=A0A8C4J0L6_DRONO|nr:pseudouridylate synthase 7 homolog-like protein [Dromaius novaehollandiae]XP_025973478.1 pseudouridylate synthase 7 homolog-like protein [Dromaius novaehollandiae]XP_025973479.1 pseudouridylate synthase 7 homolog-like protein [Dromaius novaehollandiae]XP_025973480.1 pseudouridylate synthase 7 homolog-like protein [Dromaius novaehollandiae]XP_025973481.1 pseudouridylate synthase 7 homolog-like protein [Dromaius novaehollandiae]